jgi:alkylation response protein AidB-like acyl-CoA dehydrogenase
MSTPLQDPAIRFSDEQAMLLESAASFCRERSPSARVRALIDSDTGFDAAVWAEIAQLGWLGIAVPEAFGGSGLGPGSVATVAETMGRHLMATPFVSTQLAIQGLLASGQTAWQDAWLPQLVQGMAATVALFEDDGDWCLTRPTASARRAGPTVNLSGSKTLVTDAIAAGLRLVTVQLDGELALALLPGSALPANAVQREVVSDATRRVYRLTLDGVQLPADHVLTGAPAQAAVAAIQRMGWLLASAEAAGGIAGALDVVVDYLNTRTAFGRKIGSYQGLKHPSADILVGLERARSHVAHAATLMNDGAPDEVTDIALRMAKAEAGDSLLLAGDRAVQFHGGFGFTWDCDAQLYLRRALWLQPWFGDAPHHRRHIADRLWPVAA